MDLSIAETKDQGIKLLQECADLLTNSTHDKSTVYIPHRSKFQSHPDIQYFQKLKDRYHYNFHRSKNQVKFSIDKIRSNHMTNIDPYNIESLLSRIVSYNSMNWQSLNDSINELKCSRNGWKCASLGIKDSMNHLLCTNCNQQLIIYSEENNKCILDETFKSSLIENYKNQIEYSGHDRNCSWRLFEVPLDGVYYLKKYLPSTDEYLIESYLKTLKNLIENALILKEFSNSFEPTFINEKPDKEFVTMSNEWFLSKYFHDNKENYNLLTNIPYWMYKLASYGWVLNIQTYSQDELLVMNCKMCNERKFLQNVSSSIGGHDQMRPIKEYDDENNETFNPILDHKPWCNFKSDVPSYFHQILIDSHENIGSNGSYVYNDDAIAIDTTVINTFNEKKRKHSPDLHESLNKLNKLRKLYLNDR